MSSAELAGAVAGAHHSSAIRSRLDVTNIWFNTAAFVANPVGTDGTAGGNILNGPGSENADIGFFRNFKLRESMTLQFRSEIANAFNFVNLSGPTASMNSSTFGMIQLGLRLSFETSMPRIWDGSARREVLRGKIALKTGVASLFSCGNHRPEIGKGPLFPRLHFTSSPLTARF